MTLLRTDRADGQRREHVRLLQGVQPYVHNYYTDEMFYRAQLVVGEMDSAATADWGRNYLAAMEAGGCADAF